MCCLAVILTGCDDIFASEDNPIPAYLSISDKPVTLKVGDTYRRKAISVTTAVVEYTSSDTKVATVDGEGMVTAIAKGTATITATATGYSTDSKKIYQPASVSYVVTVTPATVAVTSITLDQTTLNKKVGDAAVTLTATVAPDDATDKTVTWSSDKTAVATVADGVVTFVGVGTATITAEAKDGSGVKAICTVTVLPPGALAGVFSVSDTKKVRFSQGNLRATYDGTNWTWAFAANQYDYIGNAEGNTKVTNSAPFVAGYTGSSTTVDLFCWVGASSPWTDVNQYGISSSNNSDDYGNSISDALKGDWGKLAISNGGNTANSGWRTLSKDEWTYLFSTRTTGGTVFGTASARYAHATINTDGTSVNGMILFPDGVDIAASEVTTAGTVNGVSSWGTKCTSAQWTALAAKGCVFLPAAGRRYGSSSLVSNAGAYGYYWSSSTTDPYDADRCYFDSSFLGVNDYSRKTGFSVRLVSDVATE
jgi:uncharacterized protein YjdB